MNGLCRLPSALPYEQSLASWSCLFRPGLTLEFSFRMLAAMEIRVPITSSSAAVRPTAIRQRATLE